MTSRGFRLGLLLAALGGMGIGSCMERARPGLATADDPKPVTATVQAADAGTATSPRGVPDFADLAEAASPAVVNIATAKTVARRGGPQFSPEMLPEHLREFFRPFLPEGGQEPRTFKQQSLGSGFLVSPDGIVVTNNHVIDGADEVQIVLEDGTTYDVEVLGTDPKTDLAVVRVLKADGRRFPFLQFGDSAGLRVGEWVLAIGNPFGLSHTVTAGIISAKGRAIGASREIAYQDFLQTDASINPGNSGGPLLNLRGEVVGVNTAIFSRTGQSAGIGFAIPASLARFVVEQLSENRRVVRGFLGVRIQPVTPEIAAGLGLGEPQGALVTEVFADSPAARAGVEVGDLIVAFNDEPIREFRELPLKVSLTPPDAKSTLTVLRDGATQKLPVVVARMPDEEAVEPRQTRRAPGPAARTTEMLGMQLRPLDEAERRRADLREGLRVDGVDADGPAAEAGLRSGDVLLQAGGRGLRSVDDLATAEAAARRDGRKALLLLVRRDGQNNFVAIPLHD